MASAEVDFQVCTKDGGQKWLFVHSTNIYPLPGHKPGAIFSPLIIFQIQLIICFLTGWTGHRAQFDGWPETLRASACLHLCCASFLSNKRINSSSLLKRRLVWPWNFFSFLAVATDDWPLISLFLRFTYIFLKKVSLFLNTFSRRFFFFKQQHNWKTPPPILLWTKTQSSLTSGELSREPVRCCS